MNAIAHAQVVYITNMGDSRSVVLNALRNDAIADLDAGVERPIGLFEWSAPPGTHPTDPAGHAAANPQYGRRMDPDVIMSAARRVSKPGADPADLAGFQTEMLCQAVDQLDPAVDPHAWAANLDAGPLDTADRTNLAACIDVAPNLQHATLSAAQVMPDGRTRVETLAAWDGPDALTKLRAELPAWVALVRPRSFGWYPAGPAATLDADLRDRRKAGRHLWPPRGVTVAEIKADAPAVCMGFSSLNDQRQLAHSGQELLTTQVDHAEKLWTSDRWVFTRRGAGNVDALYSAAGAVHLARTLPRARPVSRRARGG
jgi:hypothetical protein